MTWEILAETEEELQRSGGMAGSIRGTDSKVNAKKTEVMVCTREVRVEADNIW